MKVYKLVNRGTRCKKCGGEMGYGKALVNTISAGIPDFAGMNKHSRGQTLSYTGKAIQVSVRKCTSCGHSEGK